MARILAILAATAVPAVLAARKADGRAPQTPLVTTDLIYETYELLSDAWAAAYSRTGVDGIIAQLPLSDVKKLVDEQLQAVPPAVWDAQKEATVQLSQARSTAAVYAVKVQELADALAERAVTAAEALAPGLEGLVKKTAGNVILFAAWMALVLYLAARVLLFFVRAFLGVCCGICCCGFCRSKSPAAKAKATPKPKAKASAQPMSNDKNGKTKNGKK